MKYKYIVWVGGVDDYYTNYKDAKRAFNEWVSLGYDEVQIEKIGQLGALLSRAQGQSNLNIAQIDLGNGSRQQAQAQVTSNK